MEFKIFFYVVLAVTVSSVQARIVSSDYPGHTFTPIAPSNPHNNIISHPLYSYAYNVNDAITGDSKVQHEIRDGDNVRGTYSFIEPDGNRRVVHYTADAVNGFNAVVHKELSSANMQTVSSPRTPMTPVAPPSSASVINQQLQLAPSIYPHQIHSVGSRPIENQMRPVYQSHGPVVSVPTAPTIVRHLHGGNQLYESKMPVPTASAIIRSHVPVLQKSHMHSTVIPYSQTTNAYQSSHSTSHSQVPVFVVQPFTWYSKAHNSLNGSPINPNNKQPEMLPIVRVPTATIRPPAPQYGKIPANHPNAIDHEEQAPYLNSGIRPVILGRYGYALTNAPFKLKYN